MSLNRNTHTRLRIDWVTEVPWPEDQEPNAAFPVGAAASIRWACSRRPDTTQWPRITTLSCAKKTRRFKKRCAKGAWKHLGLNTTGNYKEMLPPPCPWVGGACCPSGHGFPSQPFHQPPVQVWRNAEARAPPQRLTSLAGSAGLKALKVILTCSKWCLSCFCRARQTDGWALLQDLHLFRGSGMGHQDLHSQWTLGVTAGGCTAPQRHGQRTLQKRWQPKWDSLSRDLTTLPCGLRLSLLRAPPPPVPAAGSSAVPPTPMWSGVAQSTSFLKPTCGDRQVTWPAWGMCPPKGEGQNTRLWETQER